eukprot:8152384-Pyramimonas_sp.AAC.3
MMQELQQSQYEAVASTLLHLSQIELVDNPLVTRLLHQANQRVFHGLQELCERGMQSLLYDDFEETAK